MHNNISIILTGGTIDSHFDPISDAIKPNKREESAVKKYLNSFDFYFKPDIQTVCMKDSRDINARDRESVLEAIKKTKSDQVLITHGTYTMPETAQFLKQHINEIEDKTIILTGSMIPMGGFTVSDAPFNLGFAIATLAYAEPNIYVAMNGRIFAAEKVYKNTAKGRFETLNEKVFKWEVPVWLKN